MIESDGHFEEQQLRDLPVTSLGMEARRRPTFGVDLLGQQGEVSRNSSYELQGHILEELDYQAQAGKRSVSSL